MKYKLIAVALITMLLYMVLGSIIACGPTTPPTEYDLTISSTAGGNVTTPGEGTHTYDTGEEVDLVATADAGYRFVTWTGDVDDIADVNAATTIITMNGDYFITANFALGAVTYALTITSTTGGDVTTPVEGTHTYTAGMVVNLTATPDAGYQFANWTGDVGTIANVTAATTTITMNGNYSIIANFALVAVTYALTITSTAGGDVTTPVEGTYNYAAATVVNLTATPNAGYRFVNWTATAGTFANANAAQTTFIMPAQDATVTAHFALGTLINNVPDTNQPPTLNLPSTILNFKNFCAPMAMANILEYWDDVANHANAQNVTAGLIPETVAEYLGWFMDTNDKGSPARANGNPPNASLLGTYNVDIGPGALDFIRWDVLNIPPGPPPWPLPAGKLGYNWSVLTSCDTNYNNTLALYKNEIDNGRPLVVSFDYWNPVSKGINYTDPKTGETIGVFVWGDPVTSSHSPNPEEVWIYGLIGHAVTGVGYILNWDPDGVAGPIPAANWVIVHDNWPTTPRNVAIPWQNWMCLFPVSP